MYCNKIPSYVLCSFGLLTALFTISAADGDHDHNTTDETLVDLASSLDYLSILVSALEAADLVTTLQDDGPFTVFAPTDESFAGFQEKFLEDDWIGHLTDILTYHVLGGNVTSDQLTLDMDVPMLNGENVIVTQLEPEVQVNNVTVSAPDNFASNGVAHIIDGLLTPSWYNNEITDVLEDEDENIFSTLLDLLSTSNLTDTVNTDGMTLFAPTNEAFGKLGNDVLAELSDAANSDYLADVLKYHVLVGIYSGAENDDVATANGETVNFIVTDDEEIVINNSSKVMYTKFAFTGIIHAIDTVLIPPSAPPTSAPSKAPTPSSSGFVPSTSTIGVFLLSASVALFL